jgi:hypothetical protein
MTPSVQPTTELAVKIRLSKYAGERLAQRAAETGQDVSDVASDLIEKAVLASVIPNGHVSPAQRAAAWQKWVASMRTWGATNLPQGHIVDDSRDSIYEGRGE